MSTKSKQVKQPEKSQKNSGKQRLKSTDTKEITDVIFKGCYFKIKTKFSNTKKFYFFRKMQLLQ